MVSIFILLAQSKTPQTIEKLEKGVKYANSLNNKNTRTTSLEQIKCQTDLNLYCKLCPKYEN